MEKRRAGFVLVEVILASALFLLLVVALGGALLYGQEAAALAGNRARAVFYADEGLEAVRNIRDENFSLVTNGTYGLEVSGGEWTFSGSSDAQDIFTRSIVISDSDTDVKEVVSTVTWQQNAQRSGEVSLVTHLSGWQELIPLPEVTIVATDDTATEVGPTTGTYRISRTGSTAAALTVTYAMSGSATNILDYSLLTGIAIIPIGASFVDITLTPVNDILIESAETATATLTAGITYTIGSPSSADIVITRT